MVTKTDIVDNGAPTGTGVLGMLAVIEGNDMLWGGENVATLAADASALGKKNANFCSEVGAGAFSDCNCGYAVNVFGLEKLEFTGGPRVRDPPAAVQTSLAALLRRNR